MVMSNGQIEAAGRYQEVVRSSSVLQARSQQGALSLNSECNIRFVSGSSRHLSSAAVVSTSHYSHARDRRLSGCKALLRSQGLAERAQAQTEMQPLGPELRKPGVRRSSFGQPRPPNFSRAVSASSAGSAADGQQREEARACEGTDTVGLVSLGQASPGVELFFPSNPLRL